MNKTTKAKKGSRNRAEWKKRVKNAVVFLLRSLLSCIKENAVALGIMAACFVVIGILRANNIDGWFMKPLYFLTGQSGGGGGAMGIIGGALSQMFIISLVINTVIPLVKKLFTKKSDKPKEKKKSGAMLDKIICAGFEQIGFFVCGVGVAFALFALLTVDGSLGNSFVIILTVVALLRALVTQTGALITAATKLFKLTPLNNAPVLSSVAGLSIGLILSFITPYLFDDVNNVYLLAAAVFVGGVALILLIRLIKRLYRVRKMLADFCCVLIALGVFVGQFAIFSAFAEGPFVFEVQSDAIAVCDYIKDIERPQTITIRGDKDKDGTDEDPDFFANGQNISRVSSEFLSYHAKEVETTDYLKDFLSGSLKHTFTMSLNIDGNAENPVVTGNYTAIAVREYKILGTVIPYSKSNKWEGAVKGQLVTIEENKSHIVCVRLQFVIDETIKDEIGIKEGISTAEYFKENFIRDEKQGAADEYVIVPIEQVSPGKSHYMQAAGLIKDSSSSSDSSSSIDSSSSSDSSGFGGGTGSDNNALPKSKETVGEEVAQTVLATVGATAALVGVSTAGVTAAASGTVSVGGTVISRGGGLNGATQAGQLIMSGGGKQAVKGLTVSFTRAMDKKKSTTKADLDKARDRFYTTYATGGNLTALYKNLWEKTYRFNRYHTVAAKLSEEGVVSMGGSGRKDSVI